ncbi:MAG: hypothetical protein AAGA48_09170 [Myxococcota bacterium]
MRLRFALLVGFGLLFIVAWWAFRTPPPAEPVVFEAPPAPAPNRRARVGPRHPPRPEVVDAEPAEEPKGAPAVAISSTSKSAQEHVMAGERAFDEGDLEGAYANFLAVIESEPDDPLAAFALYKLAWVEYNIGEVDSAISDMTLLGEWLAEPVSNADRMLQGEVEKDLARFKDEVAEEE